MKKAIHVLTLYLAFIFLAAGCSGQKKEDTRSVQPSAAQKADPVEESVSSQTNLQKPLVTFIELGSVKCIPCKMMQPIMEEIEKEYAGQVEVVFHDVWTEQGQPYAEQYRIRAIPTQIFLDKDGNEYFRHEGYFPKEELVKVLKQKGVS